MAAWVAYGPWGERAERGRRRWRFGRVGHRERAARCRPLGHRLRGRSTHRWPHGDRHDGESSRGRRRSMCCTFRIPRVAPLGGRSMRSMPSRWTRAPRSSFQAKVSACCWVMPCGARAPSYRPCAALAPSPPSRLLRWRQRARGRDIEAPLDRPSQSIDAGLANQGFSKALRQRVLQPLFAGITLDQGAQRARSLRDVHLGCDGHGEHGDAQGRLQKSSSRFPANSRLICRLRPCAQASRVEAVDANGVTVVGTRK